MVLCLDAPLQMVICLLFAGKTADEALLLALPAPLLLMSFLTEIEMEILLHLMTGQI